MLGWSAISGEGAREAVQPHGEAYMSFALSLGSITYQLRIMDQFLCL